VPKGIPFSHVRHTHIECNDVELGAIVPQSFEQDRLRFIVPNTIRPPLEQRWKMHVLLLQTSSVRYRCKAIRGTTRYRVPSIFPGWQIKLCSSLPSSLCFAISVHYRALIRITRANITYTNVHVCTRRY